MTEKGIDRSQLATYSGISYSTVSRWFTGGALPDIPTLIKLAGPLDMRIEDVVAEAVRSVIGADAFGEDSPGYSAETDPRVASVGMALASRPARLDLWLATGRALVELSD